MRLHNYEKIEFLKALLDGERRRGIRLERQLADLRADVAALIDKHNIQTGNTGDKHETLGTTAATASHR